MSKKTTLSNYVFPTISLQAGREETLYLYEVLQRLNRISNLEELIEVLYQKINTHLYLNDLSNLSILIQEAGESDWAVLIPHERKETLDRIAISKQLTSRLTPTSFQEVDIAYKTVRKGVLYPWLQNKTLKSLLFIETPKKALVDKRASFFIALLTNFSNSFERCYEQNKLHYLVHKDDLTGLYNRNYFLARLNEYVIDHKKDKTPFGILMLDLDLFKRVNDCFGHQIGDAILQKVANTIHKNLWRTGLACRYGGEELIILYPHIIEDTAIYRAEKIRREIEAWDLYAVIPLKKKNFQTILCEKDRAGEVTYIGAENRQTTKLEREDPYPETVGSETWAILETMIKENQLLSSDFDIHRLGITVSIGIAMVPKEGAKEQNPSDEKCEHIIYRADTALQNAKKLGRNMIVTYKQTNEEAVRPD